MKRTIILLAFILACALNSCKNTSEPDNDNLLLANEEKPEVVEANLNENTEINLETSIVNWKGSMLFSFGNHYGTVKFKEGSVEFKNNEITSGNFVVDMNTIVNTDGEYSEDLINHLKNEDFFEVDNYPVSKLEFINFEKVEDNRFKIEANLTIKDITNVITLYNVEVLPNEKKIYTKFKIDRTDFGINYSSKGVAKIKDYAISDAIEFEVELFLNH
ncbi:YceI family protein [Winogradskyella sp. J14-2]|uniref:YceI family protein n=1 Tax=Winogradskyella sp. J14-2 TaxID=1936080 RepID=UPI0009F8D2D7|nr:YceI family protein [Winogradskyella sp. J14-2]